MVISNCEQGSPQWLMERLAIPTSSNFSKILTPKTLEVSTSSILFMDKLIAEYISQEPTIYYESKDMADGTEREPKARIFYEGITGNKVEQVGLIYLDERKTIACSPDGLIKSNGTYIKGLEIKCPKLSTQIRRVRENVLPKEYILQVQGSMWVTGLKEWDFISWHPNYKPLILTVKRDEALIEKLSKAVLDFSRDLEALKVELAPYRMERVA